MADGLLNYGGVPVGAGESARYSVLPVPYDLTASYGSGTRRGPLAIIEASTHMELYDDEFDCEPADAGISTLDPVEPTALGPDEMVRRVKAATDAVLETGSLPVVLGGEHSITLGVVQSLLERYPDLTVLHLDAHADMRDEYMDSPYNHACVARRISELCPITQVGIRSLCSDEAAYLKAEAARGSKAATSITTHYAQETIKMVQAGKAGKLLKNLTGDVFVTVDLDFFDPSIMPATGTPEPGGLGWYDALEILRPAMTKHRVVGFDVMELSPMPGNTAPDFLAAKLVYKMMAFTNAGLAGR